MNKLQKYLLGAVVGGVLGYSYYYFIGCRSGNCPITSNWHISTLYGVAVGLIFVMPGKKKRSDSEDAADEMSK